MNFYSYTDEWDKAIQGFIPLLFMRRDKAKRLYPASLYGGIFMNEKAKSAYRFFLRAMRKIAMLAWIFNYFLRQSAYFHCIYK